MLVFDIRIIFRSIYYVENYTETQALLVHYETIRDGDSESYRATFAFFVSDTSYITTITMSSKPKLGNSYTILYNPSNPLGAILKRTVYVDAILFNDIALFMAPMLILLVKMTNNFYNPNNRLKESGKKHIAKVIDIRKDTKISARKGTHPSYLVCDFYHGKKQIEIKSNVFFEEIALNGKEMVL